MAKASPPRSGDYLAGVAADNNLERVAAQWVLADVPLKQFLNERWCLMNRMKSRV
jgi:ethanolamine ammonia-lyase large subunit